MSVFIYSDVYSLLLSALILLVGQQLVHLPVRNSASEIPR